MKRLNLVLFLLIAVVMPAASKPARPLYEPEIARTSARAPIVDADVHTIATRSFRMPFRIDNSDITSLRLFVSEDQGKNWKCVAEASPKDMSFHFRAERDGLFWFSLQTTTSDGKISPPDPKALTAMQKVLIKTNER